jgi:hypothetical protein
MDFTRMDFNITLKLCSPLTVGWGWGGRVFVLFEVNCGNVILRAITITTNTVTDRKISCHIVVRYNTNTTTAAATTTTNYNKN